MARELLNPDKDQVEQQLQRMLSSPIFATRKKPGEILSFVVGQKLDGHEDITSEQIANAVFPNPNEYTDKSHPERVNATYMRQMVRQYNDTSAANDEVLIAFPESKPKGAPNYTPEFSFNTNQWLIKDLAIAARQAQNLQQPSGALLAGCQYGDIALSADHQSLQDNPMMAAVWHGLSECHFILHILGVNGFALDDFGVDAFEDDLNRAIRLQPNHWKTHALQGFLHLWRANVKSADIHFQNALRMNRAEVERYSFYHAYLFAIDKSDEAIALVARIATEPQAQPNAMALYGLWLHGLFLLTEAHHQFTRALQFGDCSLAHLGRAINLLVAEESGQLNPEFLPEAGYSLNHLQFAFHSSWHLDGLRACYEKAALAHSLDEPRWHHVEVADRIVPFQWINDAIQCIVDGSLNQAIDVIQTAWERSHVLIRWLHMMPIFDPLLDDPRFQSILDRRLEAPSQAPSI